MIYILVFVLLAGPIAVGIAIIWDVVADPEVDPVNYGWEKEHPNHYKKSDGWVLYKSSKGWILDKEPKDKLGIIEVARRLTDSEMKILNDLTTFKILIRKIPN